MVLCWTFPAGSQLTVDKHIRGPIAAFVAERPDASVVLLFCVGVGVVIRLVGGVAEMQVFDQIG